VAYSQTSTYLYHTEGVPTPKIFKQNLGRPWKTTIEGGMVFSFASPTGYTANYINSMSGGTGYILGLTEEIPIQKQAYLQIGIQILSEGLSFNSYFFAPEYSFLYNGNETYNHSISMNEIQVPLLYKFLLSKPDGKLRSIYASFGGKFRYISYTTSTVTDNNTGFLIWEQQKDVISLNKLFSSYGSPIFEVSLGYQRGVKKKRKRGWYMNLEYNYGLSPLVYTGDNAGSNYVLFHLNTVIFKIGKQF